VFGFGNSRPFKAEMKNRLTAAARKMTRPTEPKMHYGRITAKQLEVFRAPTLEIPQREKWTFERRHRVRRMPEVWGSQHRDRRSNMKTKMIVAALVLMMTSGAALAEKQQTMKERYLENLASAMAIGAHCPTWTIDSVAAAEILGFFKLTIDDISPEGKDWPLMEKYMTKYAEGMHDIDDRVACKMASAGYGPNGVVAPKMMIKK
jgi:hypothetical protein